MNLVVLGCAISSPVPDLSRADAARIVSSAPEFSRYAKLEAVERLDHADSMDSVTFGTFSFVYLNSSPEAMPIKAKVDFRYHEGRWYLNEFDYGCPNDCHFVWVFDGPTKHQ